MRQLLATLKNTLYQTGASVFPFGSLYYENNIKHFSNVDAHKGSCGQGNKKKLGGKIWKCNLLGMQIYSISLQKIFTGLEALQSIQHGTVNNKWLVAVSHFPICKALDSKNVCSGKWRIYMKRSRWRLWQIPYQCNALRIGNMHPWVCVQSRYNTFSNTDKRNCILNINLMQSDTDADVQLLAFFFKRTDPILLCLDSSAFCTVSCAILETIQWCGG